METILATAFGRIVNVQQGESDELTKAAHDRFRQLEEGKSTSRETVMVLTSKWNADISMFSCVSFTTPSQVTFRG